MPRPRVYSTPAIVLRQRKLGDADKILVLYTARGGKVEVVAKGVRKARSRMAGHVEPMAHANFQLAQGRSLDVLTQVETIEPFAELRVDLDRMSRGLYACELLDRFTEPRHESFDLYRLLLDTLRRVATADDIDTPVRFFEMAVLDAMGYRPELDECVGCRSRLEPVTNFWSPPGGGVLCPRCVPEDAVVRPLTVNGLKMMRLLLHGRYSDVARVTVDGALAAELEREMLDYVRWVLERDVRSAAFIDTLRRRPRRGGAAAPSPGELGVPAT